MPGFGPPPTSGTSGDEDRARLFRAVGELFDKLSAGRPLVVVLDDLQFADLGTLRLLHHLLRTRGQGTVRFVATIREAEDELETGERATTLAGPGRACRDGSS